MNMLLKTACLLLGVALGGELPAADEPDAPRQYDIELLIFRNLVAGDGGEVWPADAPGDWYGDTPDAAAPLRVQWLPDSALHLEAERAALDRSSQYRTLAYLAWRQPVLDRANARALELPVRPSRGAAWVDGTASVAVERYLHLSLDLKLHLPDSEPGTVSGYPGSENDSVVPAPQPLIRLFERRRMRSGELHYFDNPRFGVIALITPYEPPPQAPKPSDSQELTAP